MAPMKMIMTTIAVETSTAFFAVLLISKYRNTEVTIAKFNHVLRDPEIMVAIEIMRRSKVVLEMCHVLLWILLRDLESEYRMNGRMNAIFIPNDPRFLNSPVEVYSAFNMARLGLSDTSPSFENEWKLRSPYELRIALALRIIIDIVSSFMHLSYCSRFTTTRIGATTERKCPICLYIFPVPLSLIMLLVRTNPRKRKSETIMAYCDFRLFFTRKAILGRFFDTRMKRRTAIGMSNITMSSNPISIPPIATDGSLVNVKG
ncbi:hypothetical protein ACFL2F_01565 [Myxococcota bacterium]